MLKKLFISLGALACCCAASAKFSSVYGVVKESKAKEICFFLIQDGEAVIYARSPISEEGKFGFMIDIAEEGFYAVGFEPIRALRMPVYLKPGDSAEVEITYNSDNFNMDFTKRNTPENLTLGRWISLSETVMNKAIYSYGGPGSSSICEDFYPDLDKLLTVKDDFKKSIRTRNKGFNAVMEELVDFNTEFYALQFRMMPRSSWPGKDYVYPAFYTTMVRPGRFGNDAVLKTLYGAEYVYTYVANASVVGGKKNDIDSYLMTDRLKGAYYLPQIRYAKDYSTYRVLVEQYGKYFTTEYQNKIVEEKGTELYETAEKGTAVDFTYPDIDGKNVSLSDFRGKVVVVDVWATWCSPCKAQIPHMRKLIGQYAGNDDVVFLSVSVDEQKNYDTWKNMVKDEGLPGIHLFADGWSKIAKYYKITGIPHFMVFGKDGNVVSADSPRPSDPALKAMIDKEISK